MLVTSLVDHVLGMAEDDDSGLRSHMLFLLGHVFNSLTYISQGALESVGLDNVLMLIRYICTILFVCMYVCTVCVHLCTEAV